MAASPSSSRGASTTASGRGKAEEGREFLIGGSDPAKLIFQDRDMDHNRWRSGLNTGRGMPWKGYPPFSRRKGAGS
jgi:hypothetical protein